MTRQITEVLLIDGVRLFTRTLPLEPWFDLAGIRSPFVCAITWNRRGYCGIWELVSDRLYLVGLSGTFSTEVEDIHFSEGSVATLFPDFPERVFAHWYTGTIAADFDQLAAKGGIGEAPIGPRVVVVDIERGRVVRRTDRIDAPAAARPAAPAPEPEAEIAEILHPSRGVRREHLRERLTRAAIEAHESVLDPLGAAPTAPFGLLNAAWASVVAHERPGDEWWSFERVGRMPPHNDSYDTGRRTGRMRGYAVVRGGRTVAAFICEITEPVPRVY